MINKIWALDADYSHLAAAYATGKAGPYAATPQRSLGSAGPGAIMIIPVYGMITSDPRFGSTPADIASRLDAAVQAGVKYIILDINSPGGTVPGVPEIANKIYQIRKDSQITIAAISNSLMASAAYWIGSAADAVWSVPSGSVGSIGVWNLHQDLSRAFDQEGVTNTLISRGRLKVAGNPLEPLSTDGRQVLEETVSEIYDWFVRDVARFRGVSESVVRAGYGEGATLSASRAVKQSGMLDRIGTLEDLIQEFAGKNYKVAAQRAEDGLRRARLSQAILESTRTN